MTRVKFIRYGSSTACGNFQPGDLFSCGEALAKHFVDDLKVAEYVKAAAPMPAPVAPAVAAAPEPKLRRSRSK